MKYRTLLAAAALVLASCDVFAPATEMEVLNTLDVHLDVRAGPCGQPSEAFAALEPGQSRTRSVESGCWRVEGTSADGRVGTVEITVAEHSLHVLPFHAVED